MNEIDAILQHINTPDIKLQWAFGHWLDTRNIKLVDGETHWRRMYTYTDRLVVCDHTGQCWVKSGDRYLKVTLKRSQRMKAKRAMKKVYRAFSESERANREKEASISASALALQSAKGEAET